MSTRVTKPLRFSSMFSEMVVGCPAEIAAYGACLTEKLDNLSKNACADEFAAMKKCSQKALTKIRASRLKK